MGTVYMNYLELAIPGRRRLRPLDVLFLNVPIFEITSHYCKIYSNFLNNF